MAVHSTSLDASNYSSYVGRCPMKQAFPILLLFTVASACAFADDPITRVNGCQSVADLEKTLRSLAKQKDEPSSRALLWGSLLFEGCRDRKRDFPSDLLSAGAVAAKMQTRSQGTKALQLWWMDQIESRHAVPDFRKRKVMYTTTVIENGKKKQVPVYYIASEFDAAERLKKLAAKLMASESKEDALLLYRWWHADTMNPVSDEDIARVANDVESPFRVYGITELAIRERLAGHPGKWVALWNETRSVKMPSLALKTLIVREREMTKAK